MAGHRSGAIRSATALACTVAAALASTVATALVSTVAAALACTVAAAWVSTRAAALVSTLAAALTAALAAAVAAAVALGLLAGPASAGEPGGAAQAMAELERLYYDFEVASYCSLVDAEVGRGFERAAARAVARTALSPGQLDQLRGRAWQAAHAEWQNRGLGGFRAWCRNEGRTAAEGFLAEPD